MKELKEKLKKEGSINFSNGEDGMELRYSERGLKYFSCTFNCKPMFGGTLWPSFCRKVEKLIEKYNLKQQ